VATDTRRLWKKLTLPDPAAVLAIGPILITLDGKSHVYSCRHQLGELFLVKGLK
jgi:hypothetical protein